MNTQNDQGGEQNNQQSESSRCCKLTLDIEALSAVLKPIAERALAVLTKPGEIWSTIKEEQLSIKDVYLRYLIYMAAIPVICGFLGSLFKGTPFFSSLFGHAVFYLLELGSVLLAAFVMQKLAPFFGGSAEINNTFKLVAYAFTPSYIAGFFALVPTATFGLLQILVSLYGLYILYKGIPEMTVLPESKRLMYFGASLLTVLVISLLITAIVAFFVVAGNATSGMTPTM